MVPSLSCGRHKEFGEGGRPRIALYHTFNARAETRWRPSRCFDRRSSAIAA